ncbi:FAD-dependent monooxygenase [Roseibium sp. Sym1]|uniref:FAD-dependent monooxygenase n=1 Tax=Roseibium sp. Sym1 TaxID=3016006 RepID=UPI0022B5A927|nr:FAD-dependent monooxygenase [Roseibium sp. Sym1]
MTDVLICGAGPTGLALGIELARRGIRIRVVDRDPLPPANPRAFVLKPSTLVAAERMGLLEQLLDEGIPVEAMSYSFEGRILATAMSPSERWPWHMNLGEDRLVPLLTARLEALGAVVERGLDLTGFVQSENGVCATLKNRAGREENVETGWLIACDGVHSSLRRDAGIGFEGHERSLYWHVLDVQIEGWPYRDTQGILYFESLLVAVYRTREVFRIYSLSAGPSSDSWGRIRDFFREHLPSVHLGPALNDTAFHSVAKLAQRFRQGRLFLAGDAAHAMSPSGGLGMNSGIQDALNLGWKLAAAVKGEAGDELLDTYESERRPAAEAAIALSQQNDDLFSIADPAERSRAFRRFAVTLTHYLANGGTGYEAVLGTYGESPAVAGPRPEFGPGPGELLPTDVRVSGVDGQNGYLTGHLGSVGQTILLFIGDGGVEAERLVRSAIELCRSSGERLSLRVVARSIEGAAARTVLGHEPAVLLTDLELKAHNRLGIIERCAMWIRPDGRIGTRQDDVGDVAGLQAVLETALSGAVTGMVP